MLRAIANAGVPFTRTGPGTYIVLAALLVGTPLGIVAVTFVARALGAELPAGVRLRELIVIGITAAIGFTVALFFATAAFPPGGALAATKMNALLSFVAAPMALTAARILRIRPAAAVR